MVRGGKRRHAGRPKLPARERLDAVMKFGVTKGEKILYRKKAGGKGRLNTWARATLNREAQR